MNILNTRETRILSYVSFALSRYNKYQYFMLFLFCVGVYIYIYIYIYINVNLSVIVSSRILIYFSLRIDLRGSKCVAVWRYKDRSCILEVFILILF